MYAENQKLRAQLQQARKHAADTNTKPAADIPSEKMEAIALALIHAEIEAQRIVNNAKEKAWKILTDAKRGFPVSGVSVNPLRDERPPAPPVPAPSGSTDTAEDTGIGDKQKPVGR